jgi:hypothetical protein
MNPNPERSTRRAPATAGPLTVLLRRLAARAQEHDVRRWARRLLEGDSRPPGQATARSKETIHAR